MKDETKKAIEEKTEAHHAMIGIPGAAISFSNGAYWGHSLGLQEGREEVLKLLRSDDLHGIAPNEYDIEHIANWIQEKLSAGEKEK